MGRNEISRRKFLQTVAIGATGLLIFPQCSFQGKSSDWRFFTNEEADLVDAIVEQIIPTDEWMGAKDAGVTNYIDKQLVGPLSRYQEKYRKGLKAFKATCSQVHGIPFESLSWDEQTDFLIRLEKGEFSSLASQSELIWGKEEDKSFFTLIRNHTMQGYYGSPRHGGNKDYVSYRMLGLDYPIIEGQNRYSK